MNKQNRGDYGNAQNTPVPAVTAPKPPGGKECEYPTFKKQPHPFKAGARKAG